MGRRAGAVGFTEGVAAGNQRDGFFVVHRHATERPRISLAAAIGSGLPFGLPG